MLFAGLIITTLPLAEAMIPNRRPAGVACCAAVYVATILGYAISRILGLPGDNGGDAGHWTEPLGLASVLVEGVVVLLVLGWLADRRTGVLR